MSRADNVINLMKSIYSMVGSGKGDITELVKKNAYDYWAGKFIDRIILKNPKERKIWRLINHYLPKYGMLLISQKGSEPYYLIGQILPESLVVNSSGKISNVSVRYLDTLLDGEEWIEENPSDYIIAYNDAEGKTVISADANTILERIKKIWNSLERDIEVSQGNMMIKIPFNHDEDKLEQSKKKIENSIRQGDFLIWTSLDGVSPFELKEWNPDSKQASLWDQFTKTYSLFQRFVGIKHFTYKKNERLTEAEADTNDEKFEYIENNLWESRLTFLEEAKKLWNWDFMIKEDERKKLIEELAIEELKFKLNALKNGNIAENIKNFLTSEKENYKNIIYKENIKDDEF